MNYEEIVNVVQKKIVPSCTAMLRNKRDQLLVDANQLAAVVFGVYKESLRQLISVLRVSNPYDISARIHMMFLGVLISEMNDILGNGCRYVVIWVYIESEDKHSLGVMERRLLEGFHDVLDKKITPLLKAKDRSELEEMILGMKKIQIHFEN